MTKNAPLLIFIGVLISFFALFLAFPRIFESGTFYNDENKTESAFWSEETPPPLPTPLWPAQAVYPNAGAILPFHRIVAYYGNLYSKKMGVLGEYPEEEMLARLNTEVEKWQTADPETPVM